MKKILLTLTMIFVLCVCVLSLTTLAVEFSPKHTPRTYIYYENEIAEGNELFTVNAAIENRKRFEIITSDEGVGFAKTDENGVPLTWYVVSDDNGGGAATYEEEGPHKIVVKCVPTVQTQGYDQYAGTIENGVYSYNQSVISSAKMVVSANFTGLEIKSFASDYAGNGKVVTTDKNTTEYCEIAGTTYLLFIYFPDSLEVMPSLKCSPVIACEFENGKVSEKLTTLGRNIDFCANLRELRIPEGVTSLGASNDNQILRELLSLTYVKVPSTVTVVDAGRVFCRSNAIETIVFSPNMTQWKNAINGEYKTMWTDKGCGMPNELKYVYVPNTISATSAFDQFDAAPVSKLVFFFAGTKQEAQNIASKYTSGYFKTAASKEATLISYETYLSNPATYNNYSEHIIVYGLTVCEAFYDGVCNIEGGTFGTCTRCKKGLENPFDGFKYATREDDGEISAIVFSYDIDQELLEEYERRTGKSLMFGVTTFKAENLGMQGGKYVNPSYQIKYNVTADGTTLPKLSFNINKASNADLSTTGLDHIDLILRGAKDVWEANMIGVPLYMIGYMYDGESAYFMGSKDGADTYSTDINDVAVIYYKKAQTYVDGDFEYQINKDGTATIVGYVGSSVKGFTVPMTVGGYEVSAIGENAFNGYGDSIKTAADDIFVINLPYSVVSVEKNAFAQCANIKIQIYMQMSGTTPVALKATSRYLIAWAGAVAVDTVGNEDFLDVVKGKRPAIGWNTYA